MDNISFSAQNMIDQAFSANQPQQPQQVLPDTNKAAEQSFSEQYFPQYDPSTILEDLGPVNGDETRRKYRFAGDGKIYNAKADKPLDKVLEGIWEHNSPGLWGSAKAQTLYGLPADLSSAVAYGLGGLGLDESAEEWRDYSNNLKEEYQKRYGQFMVPGFEQALDQGKVWDYAMQNIGYGAPYMGMALGGGAAGALAAGSAGASAGVGAFLGSTAITSPVMIAQFADRQVAEMRAAGVEDPESRIDWLKAAGLGTLASGMQALPVESILFGGPLLTALTKWGVKSGTPTSARILASMADVSGTNALVGAGTGFLSRLNADMPLLDDDAKTEYLEGAIVGSLVGLPFGLYRGIRPPKVHQEFKDKPLEDIIKENEAPEDAPSVAGLSTDQPSEKPVALLGPPRNTIFHNPNEQYGIKNAEDAAAYLDNIKYEKDGKSRTGLEDFLKVHGISYSDQAIIDQARRVARLNDLQNYVKKTPDGVVYPTIDAIPQVHSNDPKVVSKAKYLTDYFGYDDATIKSLSDSLIEKLYRVNVKREVSKNKMHTDVVDQLMKKADEIVDEQAVKDVQEYGSLYNRPEVLKRVGMTVAERREALSQNPREKFAKALFEQKRPQDKDSQRQPTGEIIFQGFIPSREKLKTQPIDKSEVTLKPQRLTDAEGEYIIDVRQTSKIKPDPKFTSLGPVDGPLLGQIVGRVVGNKFEVAIVDLDRVGLTPKQQNAIRRQLIEILPKHVTEITGDRVTGTRRGLNEEQRQASVKIPDPNAKNLAKIEKARFYDEFINAPRRGEAPRMLLESPERFAERVEKAANTPDPRGKKEILQDYLNSPLGKEMLKLYPDQKALVDAIKRGERVQARDLAQKIKQEQPKALPDGTFARSTKEPKIAKELPLSKDEQSLLNRIRDDLRKASTERNKEILKANPELGKALDDMFKRFAEMETFTDITSNPTTKIFKAKQQGLLDGLENRARVLKTFENAFQYIDKNIGTKIGNVFDKMLTGSEVNPYDAANVVTLLDMAFHFNTPELKNVNASAIENIYRQIRDGLDPKVKAKLDESRDFLERWYKASHGVHTGKDLKAFNTIDLEANAFSDYIRDTFNPAYKQFKESKQSKVFNQIDTVLKRLKKELGDQGYKKVDDLLEFNEGQGLVERVPPESRRPGTLHRRVVEEVQRKAAEAKVAQDSAAVVENADRINSELPKSAYTKPPSEYKGKPLDGDIETLANNKGPGWAFTAFLRSIPSLAREVPIISKAYNIILRQHSMASQFQDRFANKFSTVYNESNGWQNMYEAHKVLDHLRQTDQPFKKDEAGRLVFKGLDGKDHTLSHQMTKSVEGVTDIYKDPYRVKDGILRGFLDENYKDEGLSKDSSLSHIKRVINGLEQKIKGNPLPLKTEEYKLKLEALEQLHEKLGEIESIVKSDNPYVPYMRFGDYVVDVIDRKTGEQVFMTSINEANKFGNKKKLPGQKQADQKINELGLRSKYDPSKYEIRHYQLTYNKIGEYLNKGLVSTDLIQSLMSSGLNENLRVADHFATGIKDSQQFFRDLSSDVVANKYRILRYTTAKGAGRFSMKANKTPGYSQDWARVMDTYLNIHANSLAKQAKLQEWGQAQSELIKGQMPQHVKDVVNKYIDYQNDAGNDFAGLREFNFVWAMGANPSSALLQLMTLPMQTNALGIQYHPHVLKNYLLLQDALKQVAPHAGTFGNKALPSIVQKTIDKIPGYFRTGVMEDTIKSSVPMGSLSSRLPIGSKLQQTAIGLEKARREGPGIFIKPAEKFTRTGTYLFFRNMFKEHPESLRTALKQREKDFNWQEFWNNHKDVYDLEEAMAVYSMLETHAVYGKEARGSLQRGLPGALLFPFTNYAQQMLEVMGAQLKGKYGKEGVYAGLWTMGSYITLAGLAGIPAYELWKTMYEQYQSAVNNRSVDAEMELKEAGVPDWMRHGLLSSSTGLDISSRIGQQVVAQKLLEGVVKGEFKLADVSGLPGKTAIGLFNFGAGISNPANTKSPMELITPVMPKTVQDVFKAYDLATEPEKVLQTKTGKMIRDPDSVSTSDIIARGMGFGTLEDKEARQRQYWQQKANQEFNQAKSRFSEGVASARYKMALGARRGDSEMVAEGREQLNALQKELINYTRKNNINLDVEFWRGFNRSVQDRLWQKLNPGKIRKPTKGEIRHIESLVENED